METVTILKSLLLVVSYAFIGGGLKYIDQVYDERIFNKKIAWVLSFSVGTVMGTLIAFDNPSTAILLSIIIGVAIAKKLDNLPFQIVALLSVILPILFTVFPINHTTPTFSIQWVPLGLLVFSGFFDEFLDEIGDRKKIEVLTYRPTMKIMVLALSLIGFFHLVYFLAFLSFDIAYITVNWYSRRVILKASALGRHSLGGTSLSMYPSILINIRKRLTR